MAKKATKKTPGRGARNGAARSKASAGRAVKKTRDDAGRNATKKAGKKTAKKAGQKVTKASAKAGSIAPRPIGTGRGATPAEIGMDLVEMVNAGRKEDEIWAKWFSPKLVSIEGGQMNMAWHGMKAVRSKADWWYSTHKVHSMRADGPYVGATGFGVRFSIDAEEIETGKRHKGDELAIYTVLNGKIVQEEFMGKPMEGESAEGGAANA